MNRTDISKLKKTLIEFDQKLDKHLDAQEHESPSYWWTVDVQSAISNLITQLSPSSSKH